MIKKIKVKENSFESEILLFKETPVLTKFNLLFGGNGVGKSVMLNGICERNFESEESMNYEIIKYFNPLDNVKHKEPNPMKQSSYVDNLVKKINAKNFSEGQSIINSILFFIERVESRAKSLINKRMGLVVVIDEVDAGLSAENINMLIHWLGLIIKKFSNVQFFISFNHYHFVYVFNNVFNMYTGKFETIKDYTTFYNILSKNMVDLGKKRGLNFLK